MLHTEQEISRYARIARYTVIGLVAFALVWGGLVPLEGAVVTSGTVTVDGNVKKVQHQQGGIVGALLVREGQKVKEGDVVLRLDDTQTKSNLGIVQSELTTQRVRVARLVAEREDLAEIAFPPGLANATVPAPQIEAVIASETKLFNARRTAREGLKTQLRQRIQQSLKEIEGTELQLRATSEQLAIALEERQALEPLRLKGLVQKPRLTNLEREIARNEGIVGDAQSRIDSAKARIREVEVQIGQVDRERIAEANKDLREAEARVAELEERARAAEDILRRVEVRAPASGMVHELATHTIGGVVGPGEAIMLIVPDPESLVIEARVLPQDIDQVKVDQSARVRFTAFNQRLTPEVFGAVSRVSPNTSRDQQTGLTFYTVGVRLLAEEVRRLDGAQLLPGMIAETFIVTTPRTALSFLLKPITDNFIKVFSGR